MKHKNFKPRKNWKPKNTQDKKIPQPKGRAIPVINGKREYYEKPSVKRKRQKDQAQKRWNKTVDGMIANGEWMPTPVVGQKHLKGKREKRKEWMKKEKVNRLRGNKYR